MNSRTLNKLIPYFLIFPNIFIYAIFILVPVGWVFYLSFTSYSIFNPGEWVGFDNYRKLWKDDLFHTAVGNTIFYWIFTVLPTMFIGLVVAHLLNRKLSGIAFFRASIYLPGVISSVAVAVTWLWILEPVYGPLNMVMDRLGLQQQIWLKDPDLALSLITIIGIWTTIGFAMLIYLAGLQGIPEHLYEAASIDGASGFKQFFYITVPLLAPISFFLLIILSIRSFQVFDLVYILTRGGPLNSTTTIVTQIITSGFEEYVMGYAASMSIFLLIITLIITLINYRMGSGQRD